MGGSAGEEGLPPTFSKFAKNGTHKFRINLVAKIPLIFQIGISSLNLAFRQLKHEIIRESLPALQKDFIAGAENLSQFFGDSLSDRTLPALHLGNMILFRANLFGQFPLGKPVSLTKSPQSHSLMKIGKSFLKRNQFFLVPLFNTAQASNDFFDFIGLLFWHQKMKFN